MYSRFSSWPACFAISTARAPPCLPTTLACSNDTSGVANAETLLRLVQSVPSPKAEPIKLWLAKVGYERMQEMSDPALALERARATWQKHGRSEKWIQQRMTGQETRNKLTDYWAAHEVKKGEEFAILTNIIHQEWSGVSVTAHKG